MPAPLLELKGVTRRFDTLEVLGSVDLRVESGESIAVVGPSGSGKSTLLHIIGGLLPPTEGCVRFAGNDLADLSKDELAAFRNLEIGYVFQAHHLLPQCTALENVLVPTLVLTDKARRRAAVERARALLDRVGLGARLEHRPANLSGGESQRVAVIRALINEPRLLLADEPTGSLDGAAADQLGALLCELNATESITLITVTHSERLADRMQRTLELVGGELRERSPAAGEIGA